MSEAPTQRDAFVVPGNPESAYQSVFERLGRDAIVRDEEDAIGRFAGVRTIIRQSSRGDRLTFLRGTWPEIKKRSDEPMLTVRFEAKQDAVEVHMEGEPEPSVGAAAALLNTLGDILSVAITIGALAYAVNSLRGLGVDWTRLALIAFGGAILYVVARRFMGEGDDTLEGVAWLRAEVRASLDAGTDSVAESAEAASENATP